MKMPMFNKSSEIYSRNMPMKGSGGGMSTSLGVSRDI